MVFSIKDALLYLNSPQIRKIKTNRDRILNIWLSKEKKVKNTPSVKSNNVVIQNFRGNPEIDLLKNFIIKFYHRLRWTYPQKVGTASQSGFLSDTR
ncbi:MAG: hypothetical protein ACI840_002301 [Ulvibacter sp.]|jgi:hypothetical protein